MKTNSQIIKYLIDSYKALDSDPLPKFEKKVKNKKEEFKSRLVINKEWDSISDRRIDLIILLDNPGAKENDENIYLSPNGDAGRMGREFIEQYFSIHKKRGQVLILNKTPFWSNKSTSIQETTDSKIKKSIEITFKVIEKLWSLNNNISIFVLGLNKDAIMNQHFFKSLNDCENEGLKKQMFFGKHPSYGHLGNQFASTLVSELSTKRKIKMNRIFKRFNNLNKETIFKDFEIKI